MLFLQFTEYKNWHNYGGHKWSRRNRSKFVMSNYFQIYILNLFLGYQQIDDNFSWFHRQFRILQKVRQSSWE